MNINSLFFALLFLFNTSTSAQTGKWTKKKSLPDSIRIEAGAFDANGKIYILTGRHGSNYFATVWEYTPGKDTWIRKSDFPGGGRRELA